jgi:steroid 5-alpha reductase family enzyme
MANRVMCGNCGGKVPLPAGYAKARIRCASCGYYADVPPELRGTGEEPSEQSQPAPVASTVEPISARKPKKKRRTEDDEDDTPAPPLRRAVRRRADPNDKRAEFEPKAEGSPAYLEGTQDEDDDRPYGVEGDGLKKCVECQGELPSDAAFCVHCGTHLDGSRKERPKKKRRYTEIDESFVEGFALTTRLMIFAAAQVFNVFFTATAIAATSFEINAGAIVTGIFAGAINLVLQAFILGSYDTLRVQRNERGNCTLTRTRRLVFVPMNPAKIEWKHLVGVGKLATHPGNIFAWLTCLYLLVMGILPGILFWWFELRQERLNVVLTNVYNGIEETLFSSKKEEEGEKVAQLVSEASGLKLNRVV